MVQPAPLQHFRISLPLATHWGPATCEDVDCEHYLKGWITIVPSVGPQADYIRKSSKRKFKEEKTPEGMSKFIFSSGQKCFREHKFPNGRPHIWSHHKGQHNRIMQPRDFKDLMSEEAYKVNQELQKG